jgi:hypothetical protein
VPAGPGDPVPRRGEPAPLPGPGWDDQERILAEMLAAFPAEDEPDWAALEDLEYFGDGDTGGEGPWPEGLPDSVPAERPAAGPGAPAGPGAAGAPSPAATPTAPGTAAPGTADPAGPAAGSAADTGATGAGFAQGGVADVMAPGPVLAALADQAWQDGLGRLDDDQLIGGLAAWQRLGARAAAGQFAHISELAARREAAAKASRDWRAFEHVQDEIALAMTLTRPGAARVFDLALALGRLPLTRAALAAGQIDERRAAVIADELTGLDDEHAAAVEALVIGKAATQTTGQLRPAVHRAVIAADPSAAKRRKEEALKDARVETNTSPSGTATLAGRDLPPAEVLAADKHLTVLARALKKTGAEGTMDELRARAYLHLLGGGTPATLLTVPPADTPGDSTPSDGTPGSGAPGGGTAGSGTPGNSGPGGSGPGHSGPGDGTPGAGGPGAGGPGAGGPGAGGPGTGTASQGTTGTGAPGPELPALRGTVNLTMPLAAWLGWSQSPGQVPGFGTLDASDSRALAAMLARDPATKWCITLTGPGGHAIAHGCAKPGHGPPGPAGTDPGGDPRAGPGPPPWISAMTITPLQTGDCTHPRETLAYQATQALRHIIEIRQATCSRPGCRRAATSCDIDHVVPYHLGGRTCECGVGPVCRHDHRAKQAPGWTLTQTQPGHMTWTTPSGRTYTTEPTSYPD